MSIAAIAQPGPAGRFPTAAALALILGSLVPAGPAAAATISYSFANPGTWTGGTIEVANLSDPISTLPTLIGAVIGGTTDSFAPTIFYSSYSELWYDGIAGGNVWRLDLYSSGFGSLTSTPATTWNDILSTAGGIYANDAGGFLYNNSMGGKSASYSPGAANGQSIAFSASAAVPVPGPLALLLAVVPFAWVRRRLQGRQPG